MQSVIQFFKNNGKKVALFLAAVGWTLAILFFSYTDMFTEMLYVSPQYYPLYQELFGAKISLVISVGIILFLLIDSFKTFAEGKKTFVSAVLGIVCVFISVLIYCHAEQVLNSGAKEAGKKLSDFWGSWMIPAVLVTVYGLLVAHMKFMELCERKARTGKGKDIPVDIIA